MKNTDNNQQKLLAAQQQVQVAHWNHQKYVQAISLWQQQGQPQQKIMELNGLQMQARWQLEAAAWQYKTIQAAVAPAQAQAQAQQAAEAQAAAQWAAVKAQAEVLAQQQAAQAAALQQQQQAQQQQALEAAAQAQLVAKAQKDLQKVAALQSEVEGLQADIAGKEEKELPEHLRTMNPYPVGSPEHGMYNMIAKTKGVSGALYGIGQVPILRESLMNNRETQWKVKEILWRKNELERKEKEWKEKKETEALAQES